MISKLNPKNFASLTGCVMMCQIKYKEFIKYVSECNFMGPDKVWYFGMPGEAYAFAGDTTRARKMISDLNNLSEKRYIS